MRVCRLKIVLLIVSLFSAMTVHADLELIRGATITAIANTNDNAKKFTIWVSGGTGPCLNTSITFPATAAGSDDIYQRAYATALMAYASGDEITAHDYYINNTNHCNNAAYIRVSKQ